MSTADGTGASGVLAGIRRIGAEFDDRVLAQTYELCVPLQRQAPKDGIAIERDLAYGPDARHRLVAFLPSQRTERTPIVAFFHGGGYIGGERSPVPGLIYDNVPTFFARHGMVGVNATYRLAPAHRWPSGGEDVGRVVAWLHHNGERLGGDPRRIFLIGHAAGATHAATWTFMRAVHGDDGPRVAGALLVSGVYAALHPRYSEESPRPNQFAYYGDDTSRWPAMWPFDHIRPGHPPVFIVSAKLEPYYFAWPSVALVDALVRCDHRMPDFRVLPGHNHVSSVLLINSVIDELGPDLLRFIRAHSGARGV